MSSLLVASTSAAAEGGAGSAVAAAAPPAQTEPEQQVAAPDAQEQSASSASKERSMEKTTAGTLESKADKASPGEAAPPKAKGIKIETLPTIRMQYEDGELFGYDSPRDRAYPHNADLNDKILLWQGDLTKLEIDCIVNAANKTLMGGGGVDGAIHLAAGMGLYRECLALKGAKTGETKLTKGHRLPAQHIAHTVGPIYARGRKAECERQLRSCYKTTLDLCVENGLRSVAFSGISTGVYGYPILAAATVACDEVRKYLEGENGSKIDHVLFCVFRQLDVNAYLEVVPAYFPPPPGTASANVVSEDGSDDMEGQEDTGAAAGEANEGQGQEAEGGEPVDGESEAEAKMEESGVP